MNESSRDVFRRHMLPAKDPEPLREHAVERRIRSGSSRVRGLHESSMDVLRTVYEDGAGEPPKSHKLADTNGRDLLAYLMGGTFDRMKHPPTKVLEMIGGGDAAQGQRMFIANIDKISRLARGSGKPPRRDMPVIHGKDIAQFVARLKKGDIDIVKPHATDLGFAKGTGAGRLGGAARGRLRGKVRREDYDPKAIDAAGGRGTPKPPGGYIIRGRHDDVKKDDVVMGIKESAMAVGKLKPSQDEIYGSKVCFNMCNFGPTVGGTTAFGKADIITTSDNFILDGHHRWATAFAGHPNNKIRITIIPLPFKHLYLVMRSYGAAIGNPQQA